VILNPEHWGRPRPLWIAAPGGRGESKL